MAITEFYTGKSDTNLAKDAVLKSGALMLQRVIHEIAAEWTDATHIFTLPASVGTIVDDDFNSVAPNFEVIDDDGDVCEAAVEDTVGATRDIDITEANIKKVSTGLAGAFTDGETYQVRVFTPTVATDAYSGAYGKYFGYITALTFEPVNEKAQLKIDIPKKLVLEGDLENGYSLTGVVANPANEDVLKAIFGMAEYGAQTSQVSLAWGSNPGARPFYRAYIVLDDENGQVNINKFLRGRFGINGAQEFISDEFKSVAWKFSGFADGFYPEASDLFMRIRKD